MRNIDFKDSRQDGSAKIAKIGDSPGYARTSLRLGLLLKGPKSPQFLLRSSNELRSDVHYDE